jgi:hypothetical protein
VHRRAEGVRAKQCPRGDTTTGDLDRRDARSLAMQPTQATDLTAGERDAYTNLLERAWPVIAKHLRSVVDDGEELADWCLFVVDRDGFFTRAMERGEGVREWFASFEAGADKLRIAVVAADAVADFMHQIAPQRTDFPTRVRMDLPGHLGCMMFGPGAFFMHLPAVLGTADGVRCYWPAGAPQPAIEPEFESNGEQTSLAWG